MKTLYTNTALLILSVLSTLSGTLYLFLQFSKNDSFVDLWYIVLLVISTNILIFGFILLRKYILRKAKVEIINKYFNTFQKTLDSSKPLFFGLMFGLGAIFAFAYVLNVWENDFLLKSSLSLFQFFVGIVCGFGIYHIFNFILHLGNATKFLKISFFNIHSPEILFVLDSIQFIAILTSIYVSISMTSILFSNVIQFDTIYVRLYSIFSFSFILIAYLIPLVPIARKIKETKNKTLYEIEKKLLNIYEQEINLGSIKDERMDQFDSLIKIRSEIASINNWPYTNKWLTTVVSVFIGSIFPIILDKLINI